MRTRRLLLGLAIAMSAAFVFGGLWPFAWRAPRLVDNAATLTEDNKLKLSRPGIVYTSKPPIWVDRAVASHQLRLELRIRSFAMDQQNTARIFTLSRDQASRNLTVGQDGRDLVVRLRRGRNYNGLPAYRVPSVFTSDDWHHINIDIAHDEISIVVDGDSAQARALDAKPLAQWNRRFRVTMGNEYSGNRPWLGEIAQAVVIVDGHRFDHLRRGHLVIPSRFVDGWQRDLLIPLSDSVHRRDVFTDIPINFFIFVPIGFLYSASLSWRPALVAILICIGLSLSVEVGQLCLEQRTTSCIDLILNATGGMVGAIAATKLFTTRRGHENGRGGRVSGDGAPGVADLTDR